MILVGCNVPAQVYVDTVGEASRHQQRLSERFPGIQYVRMLSRVC